MLLRSRPDMVHRFLLRKTKISTPLIPGSPSVGFPRKDITPAVADCRYRAPLSPRLHGSFITYFSTWSAHVCSLYPEKGLSVKRNLPCFHLLFSSACIACFNCRFPSGFVYQFSSSNAITSFDN